jgi:hypothetical protein
MAIASTFRLFSALERKNVLLLNDYLGCPILTVKRDVLYSYGNFVNTIHNSSSTYVSAAASVSNSLAKFKDILSNDERKIICDSLFLLINWFTELINAFSSLIQGDMNDATPNIREINKKLVKRLTTLLDLQQILANVLPLMKHYRPPIAIFGLVDAADADEAPFVETLFKIAGTSKRRAAATSKKAKRPAVTTKKATKSTEENDDNE